MQDPAKTAADFDLIVIGAGPAGENAADYAARAGLSAAIVESELVGGECSYWACMPSKALLRSGQALDAARRLPGAQQALTGSLDAPAVLARRDAFTSGWKDDGQVKWLESAGITLLRGHGRLAGERTVQVGSRPTPPARSCWPPVPPRRCRPSTGWPTPSPGAPARPPRPSRSRPG